MDSLVSTDWLAAHLDDPDVVLLDCTVYLKPADGGGLRSVSGRANFDAGHIPGAGFADLTTALCDAESSLRFVVPSPEQFAGAMGALGVGDDTLVVLYDNNMSMWAARVWWMLRWVGFDNAALLDGGQKLWAAEGRPLSTEPAPQRSASLTPRPRPDLIADRDDVLQAMDESDTCLIDALGEAQYRGEQDTYGRVGHIPGASNTPAIGLLDDAGRYRSTAELAAMFEGDHSARTITYCGGGIAASSDAFVMTRLGFTDVAVYTASLQEWAADPTNPLVTAEPKP
jgi:thiosulfate/3-mercaptopyruvate sulfurtransferase